jgi:hypothetical protein
MYDLTGLCAITLFPIFALHQADLFIVRPVQPLLAAHPN